MPDRRYAEPPRPDQAGNHPRRHPRRPGGDGRAARAHRHQRFHPREEGFLHRPVRCRGRHGRRLHGADLRRHHRPGLRPLPAIDHAAGRSLLVQRLLCLARRGVAFQRPGVPRAGLPRRQACRLRYGLGAFLRYRRAASRVHQLRHHRHLPGRHYHPAHKADLRRHHQRGRAGNLLSQLPLSGDRPRRHACADGLGRAGRTAHRRDPRPVRPRRGRRRLSRLVRPHPQPGPCPPSRHVPGWHPPLR